MYIVKVFHIFRLIRVELVLSRFLSGKKSVRIGGPSPTLKQGMVQ